MAATPNKVVVHVDVQGTGEEFVKAVRRIVRAQQPMPHRHRLLWRRITRWQKRRR